MSDHKAGDLILTIDGYLGYISEIKTEIPNFRYFKIQFFDDKLTYNLWWSVQEVKQAKAILRESLDDEAQCR